MNRPILVPLDGSALAEQALPLAEALAEASDSPILILSASYVASVPGLDVSDEQVRMIADAESYLDRVASRLKKRGIAVETCAPYGAARQVIVREARAHRAWLIVMATHGRGGLGRALYGSVADGVVRRAPAPILLVRAWHAGDSKARLLGSAPIIAPLDGSIHAEAALPLARSLAVALRARVLLVRAIPPLDAARTPDGVAVSHPTEERTEAGQLARAYLERIAALFAGAGIGVESIVRFGEPSDVVVAVAEESGAGLTVLTTHGRTGLDRLLLGSVAERIVRRGATPILLVRPGQGGQMLESAAKAGAGRGGA